MNKKIKLKIKRSVIKLVSVLVVFSSVFIFANFAKAATYNVPSQGSLSSVCNQATSFGDIINVSAGTYNDGGTCNLRPGVKIIGAGKNSTTINVSVSPYINASSNLPSINGSNEISGITFQGNGGNMIIRSVGRSNQKIHDIGINNASEGIFISGKEPQGSWDCDNSVPSSSATFCFRVTKNSHEPEEGDWIDGVEIYNNTLTDANLKPHIIRGAKIHDNVIDNSRGGRSGVGWTSFWWNNVDFYSNKIVMDQISWTHIAMEVWMIQNDTKFRDNWTNGWFSLLENPNGINLPYSWEITGNTFSSNAITGDRGRSALETSYSSENVLIANNLFENTGANKTYKVGLAIWGTGVVKNYTIRNNVFRNLVDAGIELNTGDDTTSVMFSAQDIKIYNNVFDEIGGVGVYMSDGRGKLNGVKIINNIFRNMNYSALLYPSGHDIGNVEFTYNNSNVRHEYGGDHIFDYGSGGFSKVSNNYTFSPDFKNSGSIPKEYYALSSGSNLIDKGVNVGQPYNGSAPDVGAYENSQVGKGSVTCTSWNYSDWGNCSGGQQSRTALSAFPDGCSGGSPVLTQSCVVACNKVTFNSGSATPSVVNENATYQVSCDYGAFGINSIKASNDLGPCTWTHWIGNAAQFTCTAGTAGTRTNSCFIMAGTSDNTCAQTNTINNVTVGDTKKYSITDFTLLVSSWQKAINGTVDVNSDGVANIRDLGIMMSNWQ